MLLNWIEFLLEAKEGTKFEFYPNEAKDFKGSGSLLQAVGETMTVVEVGKTDFAGERYVGFIDHTGANWCFYHTNHGERRASFRIISQPEPVIPEGLPDWEKDLYENWAPETPEAASKEWDELEESKKIIQDKIKESLASDEAVAVLTDKLYPKPPHMSMTYWQKLKPELKKLYIDYYG